VKLPITCLLSLVSIIGPTRNGQAGQEPARAMTVQEPLLRAAAAASPVPDYPTDSLKANSSGVAVAAVRIGVDGRPENVEILEAPDAHIAAAVQAAVGRWVVPWKTGPAGETARPRTGKLTFYFRIVDGVGRVLNPADMPGGRALPAPDRSPASTAGRGSPPPQTPGAARPASLKTITIMELEKLAGGDRPTVLDIGDREAFGREHLPGAVNIPIDELAVRAGIEHRRARAIVVDCTRDEMWRCQAAASMLVRQGFTNVSVLAR
jgi:rhodanese-related sulfurtransferase